MHLLAILEYDGTEFQGFQSQKNGRSVQDELERTLTEFLPRSQRDRPVKIVGGGRTDAGVHARGQTASFDLPWAQGLDVFRRAWNAKLPSDIFVRRVTAAPADLSARYSALSRVYEYHVWNRPERSVFGCRYAYWVAEPLRVEPMQDAAWRLLGARDFAGFGSVPQGGSTVRELVRAEVERRGDEIIFTFEANAFLYRMVRRIVGTLLLVGRGALAPQEMSNVLERKRRSGFAAPPQGLTLMEIKYA